MTQKMQILKVVWDNWMNRDWWAYANYENEGSNKIIIDAKFNPVLDIPKLKMFMANYPQVTYVVRYPKQD